MNDIHQQLSLEKNGEFLLKKNKIDNEPIAKGKVRVKPLNVGVCSSDIPRCFDRKAYFYPLIIGHEFVVSVIKDPSNKFKVDQRLAVFPLKPCFKCDACNSFQYNKCGSYSYYGSRTAGGMQSWLDIDAWNLMPIPDELDNISACFIEPLAVCVHAAKLIEKKQNVLLYGGGFLSQMLAQILNNKDCNVSCIDRNLYKKNYFNKDLSFYQSANNLKDSNYDYVIESCGSNGVLNDCIRLTKPNGKIIQLANPSDNLSISAKTISNLMRKEQALVGTWNSYFRPDNRDLCEWQESINMIVNNKIIIKNLVSHSVKIEESPDLLKRIYLRRENKDLLKNFNKGLIQIT